jgi:hypothetical protein
MSQIGTSTAWQAAGAATANVAVAKKQIMVVLRQRTPFGIFGRQIPRIFRRA